jgi:hypothetical protein
MNDWTNWNTGHATSWVEAEVQALDEVLVVEHHNKSTTGNEEDMRRS